MWEISEIVLVEEALAALTLAHHYSSNGDVRAEGAARVARERLAQIISSVTGEAPAAVILQFEAERARIEREQRIEARRAEILAGNA